ncbi:class I SAM-dependent DNA methyltransferase [Loigolactobacillus iwatensis]|uniref:class I SAM-dependent DNA methyltransferase n=1 Tax=Loigolactobacillus iwatensis TaxID=1267156 RepID=UPI000F7FA6BC|nr:class I SAM-dependent methyltransferase [Loigolactobacillus iwatensis]
MIYQTFATLYDEMMDTTLYDRWLSFVQKYAPKKAHKLLELACGTGILAVKLAKQGYQVTGLDLSEEMLTLAANHAMENQVTLPLIQGNMLDLSDIGQYEIVTCLDDSLCYMPDEASIEQVFQQVAACLKPGGQFLFDMHSLHQIDDLFPGYMYNYKSVDQAFMWTSYVGEHPHSIEHDLTFFVWDDERQAYQEISELHKERTYPIEVIRQALLAAGFSNVIVRAEFGDEAVTADSIRWFFVAQKGD